MGRPRSRRDVSILGEAIVVEDLCCYFGNTVSSSAQTFSTDVFGRCPDTFGVQYTMWHWRDEVPTFHQYYVDDGSNKEERLKMHDADFDAGRWTCGEPPNRRRKRKLFLRNVTRVHTCDVCHKSLPMTGFDQRVLANASTHGRKLVCVICSARCFVGCPPFWLI